MCIFKVHYQKNKFKQRRIKKFYDQKKVKDDLEAKMFSQKNDSGVAMGGGGTPLPTVDRHGHRIRANQRFFSFFWGGGVGVGVVTALPQTSWRGSRCAAPPQKPHPASALQATSPVCPNFEILATPLKNDY